LHDAMGGVMRKLSCASIFAGLLISGCVTVPPLQEDGIAIGEIVQRVKCEIAFAVPEPQPPWPTGRYQWMKYWTAKIDLTLTANARSTVSPTAVFTKLLPSVPAPGGGNVARNITLGLSAGVDTTAERTEVLTFSVSLAEMRQFRKRAECNPASERGLYGNLGLREWLESALAPVDSGQLKVGRHPRLGAKSPPPPPPVLVRKLGPLEDLKQATAGIVHYAKSAEAALARARESAGRDKIQPTYDDASLIYGAVNKGGAEYGKVKKLAPDLLRTQPDLTKEIQALQAEATAAAGEIDKAKKEVDDVIKELPRDPPIDSLSHSVKFVVAVSGSLSPNWLLVNFRGPSANGSLLSGAHTRTHTLSIAMGSPEEQARQLNNLVILQNLRPTQ
jgi:hypothetical protein